MDTEEEQFVEEVICSKVDSQSENYRLTARNVSAINLNILEHSTKNIVELILDFNDIRNLTNELAERFRCLKYLSVKGNNLKSLPENIGNLKSLKHLHLPENEVSQLPSSFCNLQSLETLNVLGNRLLSLPEEFGALLSLKEIYVAENELQTLPDSITALSSLQILDMSYNCISSLPENFGSLSSLRVFNLCKNGIFDFPASFDELKNLEELDVSDNKISQLPEKFMSSSKLKKVIIDNNSIISLPSWCSEMCEIRYFSLKNNSLRGEPFSKNFGKVCKKLERFDISGCFIDELPESFAECIELKFVDFGSSRYEPERRRSLRNGNNISKLPSLFGLNFDKLEELLLDECQIRELPNCFGTGLKSLKKLNLFMNDLQSLPNSFCDMESLEICVLSQNFLASLPEQIGKLKNLKELRLDVNHISSLPASFGELTNLTTLDLYENKFALFPSILRKLPKLNCLGVGLPLSSMAVNIKTEVSAQERLRLVSALKIAAITWNRREFYAPYDESLISKVAEENVTKCSDISWDEDSFDGSVLVTHVDFPKSRFTNLQRMSRSHPSRYHAKRFRKVLKTFHCDQSQFEDA